VTAQLPQFLPLPKRQTRTFGELGESVLKFVAHRGCATTVEVAASMGTTPQNVAHAFTRLVAAGRLERGERRGRADTYRLPVFTPSNQDGEQRAIKRADAACRAMSEAHDALNEADVPRWREGRRLTLAERVEMLAGMLGAALGGGR